MKLGVITDGISRDLEHALKTMVAFDLEYAELQFVWDKEIGNLDRAEVARVRELLDRHGRRVSNICHHVFAGMPMTAKPGDPLHTRHMDTLKRCIEISRTLGSPLVRIMSGKKEMILWGRNGAEHWNVAKGAWDSVLALLAPAIELARAEKATLVVETGNGTMVNSSWTGAKLIDDLDAKGTLKVLWDPANNCWAHERAWPDGYEAIKGDYLGHIHIKDVYADTPKATLEVRPMGEGQLADQFEPMAAALRADGYDGVVSLEAVYHPGNGDFEAGFRQCVGPFRNYFA